MQRRTWKCSLWRNASEWSPAPETRQGCMRYPKRSIPGARGGEDAVSEAPLERFMSAWICFVRGEGHVSSLMRDAYTPCLTELLISSLTWLPVSTSGFNIISIRANCGSRGDTPTRGLFLYIRAWTFGGCSRQAHRYLLAATLTTRNSSFPFSSGPIAISSPATARPLHHPRASGGLRGPSPSSSEDHRRPARASEGL